MFTLPYRLNGWVQLHPEVIHRLLFQSAWQALRTFALDDDGRWHGARRHYLLPARALSRHYGGHTVSALRWAATAGELDRVTRPGDVDHQLNALMAPSGGLVQQALLWRNLDAQKSCAYN